MMKIASITTMTTCASAFGAHGATHQATATAAAAAISEASPDSLSSRSSPALAPAPSCSNNYNCNDCTDRGCTWQHAEGQPINQGFCVPDDSDCDIGLIPSRIDISPQFAPRPTQLCYKNSGACENAGSGVILLEEGQTCYPSQPALGACKDGLSCDRSSWQYTCQRPPAYGYECKDSYAITGTADVMIMTRNGPRSSVTDYTPLACEEECNKNNDCASYVAGSYVGSDVTGNYGYCELWSVTGPTAFNSGYTHCIKSIMG